MSQRTCENCRWHLRRTSTGVAGECRRYPPTRGQLGWSFASTDATYTCGEWADATITPEQEAKQELVRRFAVAIADGLARDAKMTAQETVEHIWRVAEKLADAEPGNSGREI